VEGGGSVSIAPTREQQALQAARRDRAIGSLT
jgi:hypothetical protein